MTYLGSPSSHANSEPVLQRIIGTITVMDSDLTITRRDAIKLGGAAFAGAALLGLFGCKQKSKRGGIWSEEFASPYDWRGLNRVGEKLAYFEGQNLKSRWGIDVSEHQYDIDWASVATSGIEFAFVRIGNRGATAGALNTDAYFLTNALGAARQNIPLSAYYFSQAISEAEAKEEAEFALQQLRSAEIQGAHFHALAYDHERVNVEGARANDVPGEQLSAYALAFCKIVADAGYEPLIYGNQRDLARLDDAALTTYPIWYAEYDVDAPTIPLNFEIWQYSNSGTIPGISTRVDLNLWLDPVEDAKQNKQ